MFYPQGIVPDEAETERLLGEHAVFCVCCGLFGRVVAVGFLEHVGLREVFVVVVVRGHCVVCVDVRGL